MKSFARSTWRRCLAAATVLLIVSSCHAAAFFSPTLAAPTLAPAQVTIEQMQTDSPTVAPGAVQTLNVSLGNFRRQLVILDLTVRYLDDRRQTLAAGTMDTAATITWTIPADIPPGMASYRLASGGCNCAKNFNKQHPVQELVVTETFTVTLPAPSPQGTK